jgi:hypothetical protein
MTIHDWLRLGLASSRTPLRAQNDNAKERGLGAKIVAQKGSLSASQAVSRRCGIATIDSPFRGQAVGPKSLVGADSRRPFSCVCRAARRPESRPCKRRSPRRSLGGAFPCLMIRYLDPLFSKPTADSPGGLGGGTTPPVGHGHIGALNVVQSRVSLDMGRRAHCVRPRCAGSFCIAPSDRRGNRSATATVEWPLRDRAIREVSPRPRVALAAGS